MPEGRTLRSDDLQLVEHDNGPVVALLGLAPVYRAGLAAELARRGMACEVVPDAAGLPALAGRADGVVVVLPAQRGAEVRDAARAATGLVLVHLVEVLDALSVAEAVREGATGVLAVDGELDATVAVVRAAADGHTLLPRQLARALCRAVGPGAPALGPLERSWLRSLAGGTTVAALARSRGYSEREMYRLLARVYARLGASTRTEALLRAERAGLLDDDGD